MCAFSYVWSILIMWQRWRSHNLICHIQKPPCYTQTLRLYALYNRSYCRSKFYIAGTKIFDLSCDLDLDPMTFIYKLTCILSRYTRCANMNFLHKGFWKLSSDIHTDRQTNATKIIHHAALRVVKKSPNVCSIHQLSQVKYRNFYNITRH